MIYLDLIVNLSLLIALTVVSGFIENHSPRRTRRSVFFQGLLFGTVAVIGMLRPLHFGPGIIFDGRSIMVALCALFFGPPAAGVAVLMTVACRIWLGGAGMVTGALVILSSAGIGLLAHARMNHELKRISSGRLYLFGLAVHLVMILLMLTLPGQAGLTVIRHIGFPVLLLFPLATVLAGKILSDHARARAALTALEESKRRLTAAQRITKMGDFIWNVGTGEVTWSDALYEMLKYPASETVHFKKMKQDIIHPDDRVSVIQRMEDAVASGDKNLPPMEYRIVRKDGQILHVHMTGVIERGYGQTPKVFGAVQDISEQVRAFKEHRETEAILKAAMDCSTAGIAVADAPDGKLRYVNEAGLAIRGARKEDIVNGVGVDRYVESWQILHVDGRPFADDEVPLTRAIRFGEACSRHFIIRRPDEDRVVWANAAPVVNDDGEVIAGIVVFTDITQLKQAEEIQKWNARRNELLSSTAARLLQSGDPRNLVQSVCEQVMTFLDCQTFINFSADEKIEVLNLEVFGGISESEAQEIEGLRYGIGISGTAARYRRRIIAEDIQNTTDPEKELVKSFGIQAYCCHPLIVHERLIGTLSFGTRSRPRFSPPELEVMEAVSHLVAIGVNRMEMENDLRESEAKYSSILKAMDDPIYICSADLRIEYMNPAMIQKIGRDGVGEPCHRVMFDQDEQCPWCVREKVMAGAKEIIELEDPQDGKTYLVSNAPLYHGNGSISKLTVFRDLTEIKKIEARLQQAQKMEAVGSLAGGIAHDFNNLLFPIIGMAEMLLEDLPPDSQEYENAREIYTAGRRGGDLVKQILAFSRQTEQEMMPVQIQPILKEVVKLGRSTIPSNIDLTLDMDPDVGGLIASPTQLHQVVMNLMTNAYHAVEPNNGRISIQLKRTRFEEEDWEGSLLQAGPYAELAVSDTGCGIEPAVRDKIFEPYFTTKEPGKGTGLGLAVVYGIVKEHGGDIKVYSEPGCGTAFHVYFPLQESDAADDSAVLEAILPSGDEHVLVVDDEEVIVRITDQMLQRLGYQVTGRTSSVEALEVFKNHPDGFDLVITDMAMPDMTGEQLTRKIHSIRPGLPVILCTGFSERITREKAASIGLSGVLKKPVLRSAMARMVRDVLDRGGEV